MTHTGPAAWLDSYRLGLRDALGAASSDGFRSVLIATTRPDLKPREFGSSARRHLSKYLRDLGLGLDALAAPWPGLGLADPRHADERMSHLRATLELCADLNVRRATVSLAGLGTDKPADAAAAALKAVAELADRTGVRVAIHSGRDDLAHVVAHVRQLSCPEVQIAVDTGGAPLTVTNAASLAGLVGLAQLRDVRHAAGGVEEVEFGEGDVDFAQVLGLLAESGCDGPLVVRRDAANAGVDALRRGREYIESLLARSARR